MLIPQEPSAVRSPFIFGPLLSFILALTLFVHLATFRQHPESSLASIVAMCCRRHVDAPFRTTKIISSPAMSAPSWRDRHSACCEIQKRIISSPAMSAPSCRDRHSACCQIKYQNSSSPAMSNALVARLPFGLLSKQLLSRLTSCAVVGRDCCWPAGKCYNSSPAMSMPSWRDRHLACHFNNIHIYLVARPQSRALVGRDRCWLAPHPSLSRPAVSFS